MYLISLGNFNAIKPFTPHFTPRHRHCASAGAAQRQAIPEADEDDVLLMTPLSGDGINSKLYTYSCFMN
ncbi:MAG: hypothetical protein V4508_25680 [Pseudomonadota bacterium]